MVHIASLEYRDGVFFLDDLKKRCSTLIEYGSEFLSSTINLLSQTGPKIIVLLATARKTGPCRVLRLDGENMRYVPLMDRKAKLRGLVSNLSERLIYGDQVETHGEKLLKLACKSDREGIVAKPKYDPYIVGEAQWVKTRNTAYSQWAGREKLFEREREADPDLYLWDVCVVACEMTGR